MRVLSPRKLLFIRLYTYLAIKRNEKREEFDIAARATGDRLFFVQFLMTLRMYKCDLSQALIEHASCFHIQHLQLFIRRISVTAN